jgi:hypothetical protein
VPIFRRLADEGADARNRVHSKFDNIIYSAGVDAEIRACGRGLSPALKLRAQAL